MDNLNMWVSSWAHKLSPDYNREASCRNMYAMYHSAPRRRGSRREQYLDHHGIPFVAAQTGDGSQHIFDIAMTPILALDLGNGRDISSTKSVGFAWKEHQKGDGDKQEILGLDSHVCHIQQ